MRNSEKASSLTVLVAEDEALIRLFMTDALEDAGYAVVEAASADDAALILDTNPRIGLVISDVRMPGRIDGVQLARRAKLRRADRPVILVSGHLAPEEARVADAFLPKPFTQSELLKLVEALTRRDGKSGRAEILRTPGVQA